MRAAGLGLAGAAVVLVLGAPAAAREVPRPGADQAPLVARAPRNAVSMPLFALLSGGVAVQYERFVAPPRFSLSTSLGLRLSGGDDFDVIEPTIGIEGRYWLSGRAPFTPLAGRSMVGPYFGARFDVGETQVSRDGHVVGTSLRFAESLSFGVRAAFWGRVELTPSVGFGLRTELDARGRLAPWTRPEWLRLGLMLGWLW